MLKKTLKPTKNNMFFVVLVTALMSVLFFNIFYMQTVQSDEYLFLSKNASAAYEIDRASRGIIYDRNGIPLVENVPKFKVYIDKVELDTPELKLTLDNLSNVFGKNIQEIYEKEYEIFKKYPNINEIKIFSNVDYNPYIFQLEANPEKFPIISIEKYTIRKYLYPELTSHIVGYTSEINAEDYETGNYNYGDEIGKYGVELGYDKILRGQNGILRYDFYKATNQNVSSYTQPKINGNDIYLTIDIKYQKKLYELIEQSKNTNPQFANTNSFGVVVEDVNNGEILAMASYPNFDSNKFSQGISQAEYNEYLNNPGNPLSNKAIQYSQAPGSTLKILTDLVALDKSAITPNTIFEANGTFEFGGVVFQDAGRARHGNINMSRALCVSSNIYHMKTILDLNTKTNGKAAETIKDYFSIMDLDKNSGINIGSESIGYYPIPQDRIDNNREWYTGDLLNSSIGQGEVKLSPIALAKMTSVFANRGIINNQTIIKDSEKNSKKLPTINLQNFEAIEEGMECATELNDTYLGKKPTSHPRIAIKTGSAETGQIKNGRDIVHGWEISYGPLEDPQIAMSIFMEGGEGGWKGGYISRDFYKFWEENR